MTSVLHACCGPCASAAVPRLKADGRTVAIFFANDNIDTAEEWNRRLDAAKRLAAAEGCEIEAAPYDHETWLREVAAGFEDEPEKGRRCERCFRYNLAKAARWAAERGADGIATSLTISPHKPSPVVLAALAEAAAAAGVAALAYDFKKKNGFLESVARAKELGLYRQSYCGCEFSRRNAPTDSPR